MYLTTIFLLLKMVKHKIERTISMAQNPRVILPRGTPLLFNNENEDIKVIILSGCCPTGAGY